jgi:type IV secretory pathway VirB10-like protein
MQPDDPKTEQEIVAELRLRPDPQPVVRLSRKVLLAGAAGLSLLLSGAVVLAMDSGRSDPAPTEVYSVSGRKPPEALARLPADYGVPSSGVPQLGPPLPGDLGRPMLSMEAEANGAGAAMIAPRSPKAPDPRVQQRRVEREAAHLSRLFAGEVRASPSSPGAVAPTGAPEHLAQSVGVSSGDPTRGFLREPVDRRTASMERLQRAPSPFVIQAGAIIPAALVTGIRSDLPGQVTAQVTRNVYDSITGRTLLIPQGSKLVGAYDSQVAFGQKRVLLAWTRLLLPNGKSLVLEREPAADSQGYAGLEDRVDQHWGELFKGGLLSTVLGVGAQLGASDQDSDILRALRLGSADTLNQAGQQVVARGLSLQPTLTIRPGHAVGVAVTRDLILEPYRE